MALAGDHDNVPVSRRLEHAVSISACAEDANDATAPTLACRFQDGLERPGRVRVVDEDRERLPFVDLVEAAWNAADGLDSCSDRGLIHAESTSGGRRGKGVLDVEASTELELGRPELIPRMERDRIGDLLREPAAEVVADIDHGPSRLCEQTPLRLEVVVHRAVKVEMVLRQIREDEHDEQRPV